MRALRGLIIIRRARYRGDRCRDLAGRKPAPTTPGRGLGLGPRFARCTRRARHGRWSRTLVVIEIGEVEARLRFVGVDLRLGGSASKDGGYGGAIWPTIAA